MLKVEEPKDLTRDILKSETCAFSCPELKLEINPGTLGGRFTTVEGLLTQVRDDLHAQIFDTSGYGGSGGDSISVDAKEQWDSFFADVDQAIKGVKKFTVILKDPMACSYVQNLRAPDDDPQLTIEDYERTEEEEEELGLLDIKTEGYEVDTKGKMGPGSEKITSETAPSSKQADER